MAEEPKPPFVRFEVRAIEDRGATIEAGHYVGQDVVFAIVTPAGTRERLEKNADDWLAGIEEGVKQERIPPSWFDTYKKALENFKSAQETPEFGTPVKDWPGASPSQIKTLVDINVTTVEELSTANEETLSRLGMGGRALKQKAIIWLESSGDQGKITEEMTRLSVKNEELEASNIELRDRLVSLEALVKKLTPATEEV